MKGFKIEDYLFKIHKSNKTFEPFSGFENYAHTGGLDEIITIKSERQALDLHLSTSGYIRDDNKKIIGCNIEINSEGKIIPLLVGEVKTANVWVNCVDDDGYPEEICISYYLELIPFDKAPKDTLD